MPDLEAAAAGDTPPAASPEQRRTDQRDALIRVGRAIAALLTVDELLPAVTRIVQETFGYYTVNIGLLSADGHWLELKATAGVALAELLATGHRLALGEGLSGWAVAHNASVYVPDVRQDARFQYFAAMPQARSELVVPIRANGQVVGALDSQSDRVDGFGPDDQQVLETVADQVGIALANARLYTEARAAHDFLDRLIANSADAIVTFDGEGRVLSWNHGAETIYGYRADEAIGQILPTIRPQEVPTALELFSHVLAGQPVVNVFVETVHKDGRLRQTLASLTPVHDGHGQPIAVAVIGKDLTEQRQLEAQLAQSERLRALGEMASGVAHDFNNLLAAILGRVQMLQEDAAESDNKRLKRGLAIIERAARDGAQIVRRLQNFTRLRSERTSARELVALNELVQDAVDYTRHLWRDEAQRQGRTIECQLQLGSIPPVAGDAAELREVLVNLLRNAIDALPRGGQIAIRTRADGDHVCLQVADDGYGMPPEVARRAFEPFFSTKRAGAGQGLGLSVAYGIVAQHGGEILLETRPGPGTTVTLRLPLAPADAALQLGGVRSAARLPTLRPLHLLVIDDEAIVRDTLTDLLRRQGHQVRAASSGVEGLALLDTAQPPIDLVLTDLGMPDMSGHDVARAVQTHPQAPPVILITGWGAQANVADAVPEGIAAVVAKPFDRQTLLAAIARVVAENSAVRIQDSG